MGFTWNDYQKALNIVKTFEKERSEIQKLRRGFNYQRTLNDIIWQKRVELNKLCYEIMLIPSVQKKEVGEDFLNKLIEDEKTKLLIIRKRQYKTPPPSVNLG